MLFLNQRKRENGHRKCLMTSLHERMTHFRSSYRARPSYMSQLMKNEILQSLARDFAVRTHEVWKYTKGQTKTQISSSTGWLRMRVWRISLRRTKSAQTSWVGSYNVPKVIPKYWATEKFVTFKNAFSVEIRNKKKMYQTGAYGCILFLHSSYTHWVNPEYCSDFNGIVLPLATTEGHSRVSERWEYRRYFAAII